MEQEIKNALERQSQKLDEIYISTEKTRKYFIWTLIATVAFVLLPLIALAFILPALINTLTSGLI